MRFRKDGIQKRWDSVMSELTLMDDTTKAELYLKTIGFRNGGTGLMEDTTKAELYLKDRIQKWQKKQNPDLSSTCIIFCLYK